jgi:hypothetical protein
MVGSTHFGLSVWGAARSDHVIHGDLFGCRVIPDTDALVTSGPRVHGQPSVQVVE